jgi:hypothetical protein
MVELRYPLSSLAFDYLRGIAGLGIAMFILTTMEGDTPYFWAVAGLATLFVIFLANTGLRHLSRIQFDELGLRNAPWPRKTIPWNKVEEMALRYYSVRRKRKDGWMTLTLKSGRTKIDIDSTLPHFTAIVARAAHAAKESSLALDRITVENMNAIGIEVEA